MNAIPHMISRDTAAIFATVHTLSSAADNLLSPTLRDAVRRLLSTMGIAPSCKAPATRRPRLRVLVLGLDSAGKTSEPSTAFNWIQSIEKDLTSPFVAALIQRLANGDAPPQNTVPTLECAMTRIDLDNYKLSIWVISPVAAAVMAQLSF